MNIGYERVAWRRAWLLLLALSPAACLTSSINEPGIGGTQPDGQVADADPQAPDARAEPDATDAAVDSDADAPRDAADAATAEDTGIADMGAPEAGAPDAVAPTDAGGSGNMRSRARVMFSGHSLLDNPLPDYFLSIATSLSKDVDWNQQNVVGSPLRIRTRGDDINGTGWDGYSQGKNRVGRDMNIIQELLNPTTLGPGEVYDTLIVTDRNDLLNVVLWENTVGYLRHYHDRMIDGNSQSTTYLYQVWRSVDKDAPQRWIDFTRDELMGWECVASKVNLTLASTNPDSIHVIPGGLALTHLVEAAIAGSVPTISGTARERLDTIFLDDVHLTRLGIYFMAAVHVATVFDESPVGAAAPSEIPSAAATALQQLAWTVVSNYDHAGARARSMSACRTAMANDICPEFRRLQGEFDKVSQCEGWTSNQDWIPFVWPDPNWSPLPAP